MSGAPWACAVLGRINKESPKIASALDSLAQERAFKDMRWTCNAVMDRSQRGLAARFMAFLDHIRLEFSANAALDGSSACS